MKCQPDRQRDHQHREGIAAEHDTGHLVRLTLILLAEHVIQDRRGKETDNINSGIHSVLSGNSQIASSSDNPPASR